LGSVAPDHAPKEVLRQRMPKEEHVRLYTASRTSYHLQVLSTSAASSATSKVAIPAIRLTLLWKVGGRVS